MRLVHSDFRKGEVKIQVDNADDIWYLSTVIDKGDHIKGKTVRKIKYGEGEKQKSERKKIFLEIKAEKVDFEAKANSLRILGTVVQAPETVPLGTHHSFDIEEGTSITIIKHDWLDFQRKRIEEAAKQQSLKILVVVHDREEAYFALLKKFGYEMLTILKGEVAKKAMDDSRPKNFYQEIISVMKEYDSKHNFESIIVASPSFWKEELVKNLADESLKKKIVFATCSSCDEKAIDEVLKRPEVDMVLKKDRVAKEMKLVEELLVEIAKDGLCAYGLKEVEEAVNAGAVNTLLLTDRFMQDKREKGEYDSIESLMKLVEQNKGEVHIISSEHDGGKKLDGLGGIGAVLRYKIK
ncbi:mRNA surveillance protein pelota [Candidatus Woesearchaeota archaeon]|nr:mRNA surveillance protein pelota [Candidatus Woesearchaeota archaeon]